MAKYDLEKILPHDYPMILIDDIISVNLEEKTAECEVKINENKIFFDKSIDGIDSMVGIEYMAQTIGCFSYFYNGEKEPKIGFLLGTRSYNTTIEKFENNKTYRIKTTEIFTDDELVSFECFIYNDGIVCASATINAYMPENALEYIKGM